MSGQTDIGQINNKLSSDEEEIVDSILSEINEGSEDKSPQMTQQQMTQQQMAQQQMAQQQMAQQKMAQQQMAQQQMAQQQMAQQQMAQKQMGSSSGRVPNGQQVPSELMEKMGMQVPVPPPESGMEKLLKDIKDPISVILLVVLFCLPQIDDLLKTNITAFNNENSLSMTGVLFKAVLAGALFYIIKMYT